MGWWRCCGGAEVFDGGPVWFALNGEKRYAPFVEAEGEEVGRAAWSDVD